MRTPTLCALLAAMLVAGVLFSGLESASAEGTERSTSVRIGDADESRGQVVVTLRRLGHDDIMPGFKLLALAKLEDGRNISATGFTDEEGRMAIDLHAPVAELRVYPYGEFVIPDGWANVPVARFDFSDGPAKWELRVRSMHNVIVTGRVLLADDDLVPARANVSFAPLDVGQDGTARLFDRPISTMTNAEGYYSIELPTGYYQVWSYWADRRTDDWTNYIDVTTQVGVFDSTTIDMALREAPNMRGRVVDARTGEGIPATIDLFTNQYLRQLRNFTSDGRVPDRYGPDDEPEYWPVGTFNFQAWMVDPNDFVVVVKPQGTDAVVRVIEDVDLAKADDGTLVFELFTPDMREVGIKVTTHEHDIPVMGLDIKVVPRSIAVPPHVAQNYQVEAMVDPDGMVSFLGLIPGVYEVFAANGSMMLGAITVSDEMEQTHRMYFEIPFAYGSVYMPDGEKCHNLIAFVRSIQPDGRMSRTGRFDAFRDNPKLREQGTLFVPLLQFGVTYELRFAAMEGGREIEPREWSREEHFPLITEVVEITVDDEKGWKVELTLQPNPDYEPRED
jgi:hypothetical protein